PSARWPGARIRSSSPCRGSSGQRERDNMAVSQRALEATGLPRLGRLARVREWWEQEHVFGYALIVPALALLVGLVAYPFGMAIYFSLSDYWVGSPGSFVGLQNFRDIVGNEMFQQTVYNSFVFSIIAVVFKTVLGVWLAMLLFRDFRFKRLIRGAVLLPWVIPTALSVLAWGWMFDSLYSVVNWTAIHLGLINPPGPNWLGMTSYAMTAVIAVNVWRGLPFFAIIVLAGLVSIPREYYEAAEVDGAGSWGPSAKSRLPLLNPAPASVSRSSPLSTSSAFTTLQVPRPGAPSTPPPPSPPRPS